MATGQGETERASEPGAGPGAGVRTCAPEGQGLACANAQVKDETNAFARMLANAHLDAEARAWTKRQTN